MPTSIPAVRLAIAGFILILAAGVAPARAQHAGPTGFSPDAAERQRLLEEQVRDAITPVLLDSMSYALTRRPHVAGSPAQAWTRDWVLERTRAWGLDTEVAAYRVYLPWATDVEVEMTAPEARAFELREAPVEGDSVTTRPQYPWVNGYSGAGRAEGEVVYVNHGLHADYAVLDSLGVSVEDRVVVARYGRSYRGVKARLAERHGAVALLLYSDPADDGAARGEVYPEGRWRPAMGVQRGSIKDGSGDPTTPGWASVEGARRVEPGAAGAPPLPSIPVVPVGYGVVEPILAALDGPAAPDSSWIGALPVEYGVGPGPASVRVRVADDRATTPYKKIWNTLAWLPGAERPDEWVIVGAHRDAWGAGANDNVSGTASVLAAARALAALAREGHYPRRTIVFATWDAEEWGLIGSTEWVEQHASEIADKTVAYLNQDAVASGPRFSAAASPSLKSLIREAARSVPVEGGGTIHDGWQEGAPKSDACSGPPVPDEPQVLLGNLGGGSDYAPFYNHLGVPSAGWGFGGGWGQYHSAYDSYAWMSSFGDPGFTRHALSARLTAVLALRLANAEILPYDYREFACELRDAVSRLAVRAGARRLGDIGLAALDRAFIDMEAAAQRLAERRDRWLAARSDGSGSTAGSAWSVPAAVDRVNEQLLQVERALTRTDGLDGRPWYRNVVFAADSRNGYATLALPGVAEAIRASDADAARREVQDLTARVVRATDFLRGARRALGTEAE